MTDIKIIFSKGYQFLPPVVFIHGDLQNHTSLDPIRKFMESKGHTTLTFDLAGHGLTKFSEETKDHIKILKQIIQEKELSKPIIIGHSSGGSVAAKYAEETKNATSLILIESALTELKYMTSLDINALINMHIQQSKTNFKKQKQIDYSKHLSEKDMRKVGLETTDPKGLINNINFVQKLPEDLVYKIKIPILFIGSNDDPVIQIQYAKDLHKKAKSSRLEIISGGHNAIITTPETIIDLINKNYKFLLGQKA